MCVVPKPKALGVMRQARLVTGGFVMITNHLLHLSG